MTSPYQPTDIDTFEFTLKPPLRRNDSFSVRPSSAKVQLWTDVVRPELQTSIPVEWKRPKEFRPDARLFTEAPTSINVVQGSIGSCWFAATVASLAVERNKVLWKQVFPEDTYNQSPKEYDGVFHCRIWRFGEWQDVYADDLLPVYEGDQIYGARSSSDRNVLWVSLLEKAFARLYGRYDAITEHNATEAYLDLTGGVPEVIDLDKSVTSEEQLYSRLQNALACGAVATMACSYQHDVPYGLFAGHAYSLVGLVSVNGILLGRIRNPWGDYEWKGPWSVGSTEWSSIPPGSLQEPNKEDGEFYMALSDVYKYFTTVIICNVTPDVDVAGATDRLRCVTNIYGDWKGPEAAGSDELFKNPKYTFTIPENCCFNETDSVPFVLQIIRKVDQKKSRSVHMNCHLFKVTNPGAETKILRNLDSNSQYSSTVQLTHRYKLTPGEYVCIPSTINQGDEREYLIRLFSLSGLEDIRKLDQGSKFAEEIY